MSINYLKPNFRASPVELNNALAEFEERKNRFNKVKDGLDQEFNEYLALTSKTPQNDNLFKLKKEHNNLCYANKKKQQVIHDLINKITALDLPKNKFNSSLSKSNLKASSNSSRYENPDTILSELKDRILQTERNIEEELLLQEQLNKMKEKEKGDISVITKKILERQDFYKSIAYYCRNAESTKVKAENDKIKAFDLCATEKRKINKLRKRRKRVLNNVKKTEVFLAKNVNSLQQRVVENALASEDLQSKKGDIMKNLETASLAYDRTRSMQQTSVEELSYYCNNIDRIKKLLFESKTLQVPEDVLETLTFDNICVFFSQFQSLEAHLQLKYSNLTLSHSLLDERISSLKSELGELKAQEHTHERLSHIKQYALNLQLEDLTLSDLRINIDTPATRSDSVIENSENLSIFILKFLMEITARAVSQLDVISINTRGHPNILNMYLLQVNRIMKEMLNGAIIKIKKRKKESTTVMENVFRRSSTSKTMSPKIEVSEFENRFEFEKAKSNTLADLESSFRKVYPGNSKAGTFFAEVIFSNCFTRFYLSRNDMETFFKDCKEKRRGAEDSLKNLNGLYQCAHKNMKKIAITITEIGIEILRKAKVATHEVENNIEMKKIRKFASAEFISQSESPKGEKTILNDTKELVRSVFEQKLKAFNEEKQARNFKADFDKFMNQISIIDSNKKSYDAANDGLGLSEAISTAKGNSFCSRNPKDDSAAGTVQKKQAKQKNFQISPRNLPVINDRKDLLEEIKRIQSSIDLVKKKEIPILKEVNLSRGSSLSHEN
jgi:hypothetical protein